MKRKFLKLVLPIVGMGILALAFAPPSSGQNQEPDAERIAWYSTLESGLAEAARSNRPILFTSAAPQCLGVSGIW